MRFKFFLAFLSSIALPLAGFPADSLPGNAAPLTIEGDLAEAMIQGIHAYLDAETAAAPEKRKQYWHYDFSSPEAYEKSIAPNRERFKRIIGADVERVPVEHLEYFSLGKERVPLRESPTFTVHRVRWSVLPGVEAEAYLLVPKKEPIAGVIALPHAGEDSLLRAWLVGCGSCGIEDNSDLPSLVDAGCLVLIPRLVDLQTEDSANPRIGKKTVQPHREFLYRMNYELGFHLIGQEVMMVTGAVDWLEGQGDSGPLPVGLWGLGEGGMIAFYAAAIDTRIDAVGVSGYFDSRQEMWKEPIYRNTWRRLREFGDSEIASLIAPRKLIVEPATIFPGSEPQPNVTPGRLSENPNIETMKAEFQRATSVFDAHHAVDALQWIDNRATYDLMEGFDKKVGEKVVYPGGSAIALDALMNALTGTAPKPAEGMYSGLFPMTKRPQDSGHRTFKQMVDYAQAEMRSSHEVRDKFWEKEMATLKDHPSPEAWEKTVEEKRRYFHEEIIGKLPDPAMPPNPRLRVVYDTPKYTGYETVLDVWPGVIASGILLVPKDLKEGERRPVVVCQHGLEGRPKDTIENNNPYYEQFAAKLAEEGFIAYAPQNPYIFGDKFRSIQRKANPLGLSLFSFIVGQHQQTLNWLETLPFVDPKRMAFYGLSYGGKTAMRVPAIEKRYCLSICSGDFNDWITKNCTVDSPYSYMFTGEYEMPEWNLGRTFNYAEMARLIAPRPFMVERGHFDGVAPDEWVAAEYSKVKFLYDQLGIGDRTELEYFNGPHKINGVGTFAFLRKWLEWPKK